MNYESYSKAKNELGSLLDRQLHLAQKITPILQNKEEEEKLLSEQESLRADTLNVLVMGEFSSGKSTFLNALLGDKIFPSSARPCTGCIAEIQYSDNWSFTLKPKDNSKAPFNIRREQLKEYTTIDHNDTELNPYEKVIVHAPMPLCKHGVKLIDSPGLNDPTSHDKTTLGYMPLADATIYCMDSGHANSKSDGMTIDLMKKCGHNAIIYVLTHIDQIDEDEVEDVCKYLINKLEERTSLGKAGIFFLNSKGALQAKMDKNPSMLKESRFPAFEVALEKILAGEKGSIKLGKICGNVAEINSKYVTQLRGRIQTRQTKREKVKEKLIAAALPLEQAHKTAEHIRKKTHATIVEICDTAATMAGQYHLSLGKKVSDWVDNLEPNAKPENLQESLNHVLKLDMADWFKSEIVKMMTDKIKAFQKNMGDDARMFASLSANINAIFEPCLIKGGENNEEEESTISVGFLSMPSLFSYTGGAVGLTALVLTGGAATTIVPACWYLGKYIGQGVDWLFKKHKLNKLKDELKNQLPARLNQGKQEFINHVKDSVRKELEKYNEKISEKLKEEITHAEMLVQDAKDSINREVSQLETEAKQYDLLLKACESVAKELKTFRTNYI